MAAAVPNIHIRHPIIHPSIVLPKKIGSLSLYTEDTNLAEKNVSKNTK
jgi:hypothetical protein